MVKNRQAIYVGCIGHVVIANVTFLSSCWCRSVQQKAHTIAKEVELNQLFLSVVQKVMLQEQQVESPQV